MDGLFVKQVRLVKEGAPLESYPFNIALIKHFNTLTFESPVSFFIGENGVGKSTFMEALAVGLGLNAEGGTQNFLFQTANTHSDLYQYLKIIKGYRRPQTKFFLRAESFYNVATELEELDEVQSGAFNSYGGKSLHQSSHGESFMQLMTHRFSKNGLYLLDEPEAALSPSRQLALLILIHDLAKGGSQFIISTHSPILLTYRDGIIYDLNHDFKKVHLKDTDIYQTYKLVLDDPESLQHHLLDDQDEK
ncbi:AAA family ATPase [Beduini massiliensis]|uniref:AAA family ATPase n=1 Tax=Beduini massiliensis TaxID=1585974 RepID=UPI00059AA800|nr:AAA family ATPase [Beduini massiliensis]